MNQSKEAEQHYQSVNLNRDVILERLRARGCRITKQRELLIEVILQGGCSCCKEIYYMAIRRNPNIGMATIYRMMNILEEIGAVKWRNEYELCEQRKEGTDTYLIELEDQSHIELEEKVFRLLLEKGMESLGYLDGKKIQKISPKNDSK